VQALVLGLPASAASAASREAYCADPTRVDRGVYFTGADMTFDVTAATNELPLSFSALRYSDLTPVGIRAADGAVAPELVLADALTQSPLVFPCDMKAARASADARGILFTRLPQAAEALSLLTFLNGNVAVGRPGRLEGAANPFSAFLVFNAASRSFSAFPPTGDFFGKGETLLQLAARGVDLAHLLSLQGVEPAPSPTPIARTTVAPVVTPLADATLNTKPTPSVVFVVPNQVMSEDATLSLLDANVQADLEGTAGTSYALNDAAIANPPQRCSSRGVLTIVDSKTGALEFAPSLNWNGTCEISVDFFHSNGARINSIFRVTTTPVNDVPAVTLPCSPGLKVNTAFSCTSTATNPDGESLTWSLSAANSCGWASVNSATGAISGTPTATGMCSLALSVHDASGGDEVQVSQALAIAPDHQFTGAIGTLPFVTLSAGLSFTATFVNQSGESMTVDSTAISLSGATMTSSTCGMLANNASCNVTYTLSPSSAGTFSGTLSVNYSNSTGAHTASAALSYKAILDVTPVYNGYPHPTQWIARNSALDEVSQSGSLCSTTSTPINACLHAGEMRQFIMPDVACADVKAADTLDVFEWRCKDVAPNAKFFSRLRPGKGLSDLVDFSTSSWKANRLVVSDLSSTILLETTLRTDWFSPGLLYSLPPNAATTDVIQTLGVGGTPPRIYLAKATGGTPAMPAPLFSTGYKTGSPNVAILVSPDTILKSNDVSTPATTWSDGTARTALVTSLSSFNWFEGAFESVGTFKRYAVIAFYENTAATQGHNTLRNARLRGGDTGLAYVAIGASSFMKGNEAFNVSIEGPYTYGIFMSKAEGNLLRDVRVASITNGGGAGIKLLGASNSNAFHRTNLSHVPIGVRFHGASENTFTQTLVHSAARAVEFSLIPSDSNVIDGLTASHVVQTAIDFTAAVSNNSILNTLVYNTPYAVRASVNPSGYLCNGTVTSIDLSTNQVSNLMHLGGTSVFAQCVTATTPPTFKRGVETDATVPMKKWNGASLLDVFSGSLPPQLTSAATWATIPSASFPVLFAGPLELADASNPGTQSDLDASTGQPFGSIMSWTSFSSPLRGWVKFPSGIFQPGACLGGNCRVADFALASASVARNGSLNWLGTTVTPITSDAIPCGSTQALNSIDGVESVSGSSFVMNAAEIFGDFFGNDNGRCEAGERCIHFPNLGAYQGSGALKKEACALPTGGAMTGVMPQLHSYETP